MNQQIQIGPKFFQSEIRVYRDFALAFWRENLQNSVDAGSTRIDITCESQGEVDRVVIRDNGCGMSREILETIYFTLGETSKNDCSTIGGYGKARILTCFCQKRYTLQTGNLLVTGSGASYKIEEQESHIKGVTLDILVFNKGRDLIASLKSYLACCYLPCQVTVNGEKWTQWTHNNRFERSLSFGDLYTNKSRTGQVLVRSSGTLMFHLFTSCPHQVILEIDPTKARDVLQANRDGLIYQYQSELESFVSELNINKQSALRPKRSKSIHYEGSGTFVSTRKSKDKIVEVEKDFGKGDVSIQPVAEIFSAEDLIEHTNTVKDAVEGMIGRPLHNSGFVNDEESRRLTFPIFDVYVDDDTENSQIRKIIESYYPHSWDLLAEIGTRYDRRYGEFRSFRAGIDKFKLLVLWKAAVAKVMEIAQSHMESFPATIAWGAGWIFSDQALAKMKTVDGIHWLLINPVESDGKMKYSISGKTSLIKLISAAVHEVTHLVVNDHDEYFCNIMNDLFEHVMNNLSDVVNAMKSAKDAEITAVETVTAHNKRMERV